MSQKLSRIISASAVALLLAAGAVACQQQAAQGPVSQVQATPAANPQAAGLRKVEDRSKVCMVNNQVFDKTQIPIEVEGKTYYGCCEMCKDRLANDAEARFATDPVSGARVDKATAVIGAQADGTTFYFENEANLQQYAAKAQG